MTLAELRNILRVLVNDHADANRSVEPLTLHLDNVIDGVNKMFYVMNRRVVVGTTMFVNNGVSTAIPYNSAGGYVTIDPAPPVTTAGKIQYFWQKMTDTELDVILNTAIRESNLTTVETVDARNERVVLAFAKASIYLFMANHAAEYYTISAGGKTVSKDAIFQHYIQLYNSESANAMRLRDDYYQRQGERNLPSAVATGSDLIDEDWT